jgi:septal ring factor EnvC (AmiA/AmiB activator)
MRTKRQFAQLEARLTRLEEEINRLQAHFRQSDARADQFQDRLDQATTTVHDLAQSEESSALSDLKSHLGRQLAIQADRLASLSLKLDMMHSRVERLSRIQDEIHQTQEEHTGVLTEILERIPDQEMTS